ncbi:MAG: MFS transporter [Anaerolineae bacterium]|jgi:FHS family Na+ dependent glucose MFS transporter 1
MRSTPASHWARTSAYFGLFVGIGLVTSALGPTLPGLAAQAGAGLDEISILFMTHAAGYLLGSFIGGRFYDRVPGHHVMLAALGLLIVGLVAMPLLPTLALLASAWLLVGFAGGGLDVGGNTLMVWLHGREVGPYMNGLHFFFGVGSFLGPLVAAGALALAGDATRAYWALALGLGPLVLWLARVPGPAGHAADPGAAGAMAEAPAAPDTSRSSARGGVVVALIALLLLLYVGAEASVGGWIYTYAEAMDLADAATAAYLTSGFWGALTVGRLAAIPIAARFRPRSILLADLLGCLASAGLILALPASRFALWAGTLGLGASMASIFPTAITLAERRVAITGRITGWFLVGSSIGAMALPWIIGQLFGPAGPRVAVLAVLVTLAVALAVLGVLLAYSERD